MGIGAGSNLLLRPVFPRNGSAPGYTHPGVIHLPINLSLDLLWFGQFNVQGVGFHVENIPGPIVFLAKGADLHHAYFALDVGGKVVTSNAWRLHIK